MNALKLFFVFLRIGAFTFGGGYGMIPLIQQEITSRGWMDATELYHYIGLCESTPGPIAVNMATLIGSMRAGFVGSFCATLGVILPAFVIMLLIARVLRGFRNNRYVQRAFRGVRAVVAGMIAGAGINAGVKCLLRAQPAVHIDGTQLLILALVCAAALINGKVLRRRFSPILLILFSAVCGIAVYGFGG